MTYGKLYYVVSVTRALLYPRGSRLRRSQPATKPAILITTSLATELATPSVTDVRTNTLPRLIYEDY